MNYKRPIHQIIDKMPAKFNADYFSQHNILFGGGTRIALELGEYRESVDIDFLCANTSSYKAVRSEVTSNGLGCLLADGETLEFCRDIRADRDAIRAFVKTSSVL